MRKITVALLLGLTACTHTPGDAGDSIKARAASWQGAPADELVAVLGEPVINSKGTWVWKFDGPRLSHSGQSRQRHGEYDSLSVVQSCSSCTPGQGMMTTDSGGASAGSPTVCAYLGYIDNGTVTKITTYARPGTHCGWDELPLRVNQ